MTPVEIPDTRARSLMLDQLGEQYSARVVQYCIFLPGEWQMVAALRKIV
jgi:hypothetical protein